MLPSSVPRRPRRHGGCGVRAEMANDSVELETSADAPGGSVPVVGIGASAGGLSAFESLLTAISPDSGLAFVIVQHLAPEHESALASVLQRLSPLPVTV